MLDHIQIVSKDEVETALAKLDDSGIAFIGTDPPTGNGLPYFRPKPGLALFPKGADL